MNNYIDIYCERLEPDVWAEPVNALTNLSFIVAAFFAYRLAQREGALDWRAGLLIVLIVAIGSGSFLFHTLAVFWSMLADTLPILFYQIAFLSLYAQRVMGLRCLYSSGLLAAFFVTIYLFGRLPEDWLNGSLSYGPALIFLAGLGLWHAKHAGRERYGLLLAAFIFLMSLTLRSVDMRICSHWPVGTHFMWHILNGAVLYLTTRSYILNAERKP